MREAYYHRGDVFLLSLNQEHLMAENQPVKSLNNITGVTA